MIYFSRAADGQGPIKIGYAKDPAKRLAAIQRMSPVRLCILATIEGERQDEADLHTRFSGLRLWGEWFKPSKLLLEFVGLQIARLEKPTIEPLTAVPPKKSETDKPTSKPIIIQNERHYTLDELADVIRVSVRTLRRWISNGRISPVKKKSERGFQYLVPASKVIKLGFKGTNS